jgi:hypothetical protein
MMHEGMCSCLHVTVRVLLVPVMCYLQLCMLVVYL